MYHMESYPKHAWFVRRAARSVVLEGVVDARHGVCHSRAVSSAIVPQDYTISPHKTAIAARRARVPSSKHFGAYTEASKPKGCHKERGSD